jgi:RimJ/RimL family protein N-acetyltransferase
VRVRRAEGALGVRERSPIDLAPLFGLRLRTARLDLRLPTDDEIVALARLAEQGIHPADFMPFAVAWTDGIGTASFLDDSVAYHLGAREAWRPEQWRLNFVVVAEGELIGTQGLEAENFATTRVAQTGSWLGQRFQRRGYGTEMRAAVLDLLFRGLDGQVALSGAIVGNDASARVSEKLGYESAGEGFVAPRGEPVREQRFRLAREAWDAHDRIAVEIDGLEACLPLFGL